MTPENHEDCATFYSTALHRVLPARTIAERTFHQFGTDVPVNGTIRNVAVEQLVVADRPAKRATDWRASHTRSTNHRITVVLGLRWRIVRVRG